MNTVIRIDAHAGMGAGHAMRCLTLANELKKLGHECTFLFSEMNRGLQDHITAQGHRTKRIESEIPGTDFGRGWEQAPAEPDQQVTDYRACQAALGDNGPDLIIVDHYLLDHVWEAAWDTPHVLVIDDLANRRHHCSILLDQNLGRRSEDYVGLVPDTSRVLPGPEFSLLRPEFGELRDRALDKRRATSAIKILLVNFGAADAGGHTLPVLEALKTSDTALQIRVICGGQSPSLPALSKLVNSDPAMTLLLDRRDMAEQMVEADLAVGASGSTSWERCSLGLPSIVLGAAENQREILQQLVLHEAALEARNADEAAAMVRRMVADHHLWSKLSEASASVADGRGCARVVEALSDTLRQ